MFGYLFGRNKGGTSPSEQPEATAEETATTGIRYDPSLISELKSDHGRLVSLFQDIAAITNKRDARLLTRQLDEFGDKLREHLLKENVRFYVYLKSSLPPDGSNLATSQTFAREMQQIGRVVTNFLHKYTSIGQWEDGHWPAFESELAAIGRVLTQRIESEEGTLYPLYLPPGENQ